MITLMFDYSEKQDRLMVEAVIPWEFSTNKDGKDGKARTGWEKSNLYLDKVEVVDKVNPFTRQRIKIVKCGNINIFIENKRKNNKIYNNNRTD